VDEVDNVLRPVRDAFALVKALFDEDRSSATMLPG